MILAIAIISLFCYGEPTMKFHEQAASSAASQRVLQKDGSDWREEIPSQDHAGAAAEDAVWTPTALPKDPRFKDRSGEQFGRWAVIGYDGRVKRLKYWMCRCECGTMESHAIVNLSSGRSKSCGCLTDDKFRSKEPQPPEVIGARWVQLTKGRWCLVDEGDFGAVSNHRWYLNTGGYAASDSAERRTMHCFLMKPEEGRFVDHRSGNTLDNRRKNLRVCTPRQNSWNQKRRSNNSSGLKGASFLPKLGKWRARIRVNGNESHLGLFETKEEAHAAYVRAAEKYFGEFARAA